MNATQKLLENCDAILLDIEGTTTSISFVRDTLFPYVRENLSQYLDSHWDEADTKDDIQALKKQAEDDIQSGTPVTRIPTAFPNETKRAVVTNVLQQMDCDRKTTALKQLQGHIWKSAYESGNICGHTYEDFLPALQNWFKAGKKIYIYSSGSVQAQKLLFGHTKEGSLLQYFSGHFDTSVGPKVASSSYSEIAKQLATNPDKVVFFTDIPKEAGAAVDSGMHAVLVEREGNAPLTDDDRCSFPVIQSFEGLSLS